MCPRTHSNSKPAAGHPPRRLAHALGGTLVVSNRRDVASGVLFRLTLPLEVPAPEVRDSRAHSHPSGRATPGPATPAAAAPGPTPLTALGYHVLVVDDYSTNRRIAERCLRALGCTCALAEDGDEVLDALARERFDLVLLDIHMARMNGDVACVALREHGYTTLPVIAVTGNATSADAEKYRRIGFNATLGKPFGTEDLRAVLERCIGAAAGAAAAPAAGAPRPPTSVLSPASSQRMS